MKTIDEMKNMIMVCLKEMIADEHHVKKFTTTSHNKRLSDKQFLEHFAQKYGDRVISDHGANDILNLFTTELNMKWVSDGKKTSLDGFTIGGMPIIDYIKGFQLTEIKPERQEEKAELTEEEQLEALYGKMFENKVIDQTIIKHGQEIPHKERPVPRIMPETDDEDEEVVELV
jgi:outer membrane protein assembly factor BamA